MGLLLTVFSDVDQKEHKFTNQYRRALFNYLATAAESERYIVD